MFKEHVPLIKQLHGEGLSHSMIAALTPPVGEGQWETYCSTQMIAYILSREGLDDGYSLLRPEPQYNADFAADFRRLWEKWERCPQTWFEKEAERLWLELASIIKALEMRNGSGTNDS